MEYTVYRVGSTPDPTVIPTDDPADSESVGEAISRFGHMDARRKRRFLRYSLVLQDGTVVRIELRRVRDWNTDKKIPERIAAAIGVDLEFSAL